MLKYFKYLQYLLKHKFYVGLECFKTGLITQGIFHDCSKLLPSEFFPYMYHFYGKKKDRPRGKQKEGYYKPTNTGDLKFDTAWLFHQNRNKHHWQFFCLASDSDVKCNCGGEIINWNKVREPKNVIDVDLKDPSKIFQSLQNQMAIIGSYVKNIGENIARSKEFFLIKDIQTIGKKDTQKTKKVTKEELGKVTKKKGYLALSIMEELLQNVAAVEKNILNFLQLTTLMEEGISTEDNFEKKEVISLDGSLKKVSQKDLEFYATTAIQQLDITDIAPTGICDKCGKYSYNLVCLPMPKKFFKEMICDWIGAGKAQGYGNNTVWWYNKYKNKMMMEASTREMTKKAINNMDKGIKWDYGI